MQINTYRSTLGIVSAGLLAGLSLVVCHAGALGAADAPVREDRSLDYTQLGVYTSLPFADFEMGKMSLDEGPFPNKKQWWEAWHAARQSPHWKPNVLQVWFWDSYGEKDRTGGPFEKYRARFDAWLAPEEGIATYPEDLTAITLAEENSPYAAKNFELLNQLADHVGGRYGVPVYQWYTDPLPPNPKQIADGWVFDAYKWKNPRYRRHLMKFMVLGKPVIAMPWAADPDDGYFRFETGEDLIGHTGAQFRTCMEFNVPTAIYAVSGGSVNNWRGRPKLELEKVRQYIATLHAQMRSIPPDMLPLPTANFSHGVPIVIAGESGASAQYVDEFDDCRFIDVAEIDGFLNLILTSEGALALRGKPGRDARAVVTFHFWSQQPLAAARVQARCTAPTFGQAQNELAISVGAGKWSASSHREIRGELGAQVPEQAPFTQFRVRLTMQNNHSDRDKIINACERIQVQYQFADE